MDDPRETKNGWLHVEAWAIGAILVGAWIVGLRHLWELL